MGSAIADLVYWPGLFKGKGLMKKYLYAIASLLLAFPTGLSAADEDPRKLVELPEMMQDHMLSNMRDHLAAINEILIFLAKEDPEKAAAVAESRLGMSSLESHGASHMAKFMPQEMREIGTGMHRAASRFALKAQEGELLPAYRALADVTSSCVACHAGYRVR